MVGFKKEKKKFYKYKKMHSVIKISKCKNLSLAFQDFSKYIISIFFVRPLFYYFTLLLIFMIMH
jgi:hypothetical protein